MCSVICISLFYQFLSLFFFSLLFEPPPKKIVTNRLRQGGYAPKLTDSEIITMQLVGEFLQMDTDSQIHQYFKQHWQAWFSNLGSYPNFAKLCVNLLQVKTLIQQHIVKQHGQDNIHFIDGFAIPVCQYARAYRLDFLPSLK